MNPIQQSLKIIVCKDADDAIQQGHFYNYTDRGGDYKPIQVNRVVVVQNGTTAGNSTVDFVLEDETGQKYVVMLTGALLKSIPC